MLLFCRAGIRKGLLEAGFALLALTPVFAQQEEPETVILSRGEGVIVFERRAAPLPWMETARGPLVAFAPVVDVVGGALEIGPLGEGHTLRIAGRDVILGPLGRVVVVDGEMEYLSVTPWLEPRPEVPEDEREDPDDPAPPETEPRRLFVPLDALSAAYPAELGYRFEFDRRRGRLEVTATGERRLAVDIERVHDLGATTLAVTFSGRPRYRVDRYPGGISVRLLSGVMEPRARRRLEDPLVRWIEVRQRSIEIGLAPRAAASEPYLLGSPPRVQLVIDVARDRIGQRPRPLTRLEDALGEFRVVVDPGHGGADTGVVSSSGDAEKDLTLSLAQELRALLEERLGARVVLTRNDDSAVPLEGRTAVANQHRADLFLSLHAHADGAPGQTAQVATWLLEPPPSRFGTSAAAEGLEETDESAATLQSRRDATSRGPLRGRTSTSNDEITLVVPPLEPWERAHDGRLEQSLLLARLLQREMSIVLGRPGGSVGRAPLRVLTGASMPAVFIEFGLLGDEDENDAEDDPQDDAEGEADGQSRLAERRAVRFDDRPVLGARRVAEAPFQSPDTAGLQRVALVEAIVRAIGTYRDAMIGANREDDDQTGNPLRRPRR